MPPTVTWRGTREDLARLLRSIPAILAGRVPDPAGVARLMAYRLANVALSKIQQGFVTKARGGTADGAKWAPLAASTAKRRLAKERKATKGKKGRPNPYAGQYEIGRDTGRLFRSLAAGTTEDKPAANPDQVIRLGRGELVIGTNVPYAAAFDAGRPGKQPARSIGPPGGRIPSGWSASLNAAFVRGMTVIVEMLTRRGPTE